LRVNTQTLADNRAVHVNTKHQSSTQTPYLAQWLLRSEDYIRVI